MIRRGSYLAAFICAILCPATPVAAQPATLAPTLQLRTLDGVTVPYQNGVPVPGFEKQQRTTLSLNGPWRSQRFAAADGVTLTKRDSAGYAGVIAEAAGRQAAEFDDGA
jgi:beta-glucuronidase